ncbi:hypothetical protein SeMB42_g03686 [Synchytrium endobioticum]|uniref:Reverse transcriptase RNase H-like domain-containing protein n=1 Tax=Synchytrium endobioticum TaxID=286115 RepID=A0A507D580_9FUNG|nr:hypothetical protein SeMB42_g03686 [Synchytrium endobioticum]
MVAQQTLATIQIGAWIVILVFLKAFVRFEDGNLGPIEFFSKNYSTPDKESLGLVLAQKHYYPILFGNDQHIYVFTDHKSSRDFSKTQLLKPRHVTWLLVLEDRRIEYGKDNVLADACSRNPKFNLTEKELKAAA